MKIKKFLEKVAEEDRESQINEKDIQFLASIGVDYNKKREADSRQPHSSYYLHASAFNQKAFLIGITGFIVALFAIFLILFYTLKPAPFEPPIEYFEDNFLEVDSNITELNGDLKLFSVIVDESQYKCETKKVYDSVSGDTLYYSLSFAANQGMKTFKLDIVVNSNYDYDKLSYTEELKETQISDYSLKYTEDSMSIPNTPLFIRVYCQGEMQIGEQWVYITKYEETAIGQGTLINTLQSIISFN